MNTRKHIVLLGAGAVGVLPAVRLLRQKEIRLTVAADAQRIARYRQEGIYFNGTRLAFDFASPEEMAPLPPADLILAATKTPSLEEALENVQPLTAPRTVFLPLLNGITAHEVIQKRFPGNTVLKGYFLGHASVRENNRITHDGVGTFFIGGQAPNAEEAAALLKAAGVNTELPADIHSAMWRKFVLNVGVNQTQAFFGADYGTMQKSPELMAFAAELMEEAVRIARMENISGTETMVADAVKVILEMPGHVKTSMLQDVLAGRRTEVDAFAGTICAKAEKYGLDVPFNKKVLEKFFI
ncbi:MAG: ketopantoate reductase family protein [Lentisphaeria bacterium]|nr:ketopantoate reductase family protein [Lentisphaeria bacterium]